MSTEHNVTPAQELRAAASKIRDLPEKAMLANWLKACADDMDAKPGDGPDGWGFALETAREINGSAANSRHRITRRDGSVTALNDAGHVLGWTERGPLGWSAFWRTSTGSERRWADTPEAAAQALFAGIAEEAQQ